MWVKRTTDLDDYRGPWGFVIDLTRGRMYYDFSKYLIQFVFTRSEKYYPELRYYTIKVNFLISLFHYLLFIFMQGFRKFFDTFGFYFKTVFMHFKSGTSTLRRHIVKINYFLNYSMRI